MQPREGLRKKLGALDKKWVQLVQLKNNISKKNIKMILKVNKSKETKVRMRIFQVVRLRKEPHLMGDLQDLHILLLQVSLMIDGFVQYVLIFLKTLLKRLVVIICFVKNVLKRLSNVLFVTRESLGLWSQIFLFKD